MGGLLARRVLIAVTQLYGGFLTRTPSGEQNAQGAALRMLQ